MTRRPGRRTAAGVAVLAAALLGGCTSDVGASGDQGYVSGKGIITTLATADRKPPGEVAGTTLDGEQVSLADYRGKVVVVNVWGSWCSPCRAEAPLLADLAREMRGKGVVFLGINSRDPEQAGPRAFQRQYDVPYPSIYDPDGRTLLAFYGTLPPNAVPATVVIDRRGRVAASANGEVRRSTLVGMIEDADAARGRT